MASVSVALVSLYFVILSAIAHSLHCPPNVRNLAYRMLESNIARGQGKGSSATLLAQIEPGIFQQAPRECIQSAHRSSPGDAWKAYLQSSVSSEKLSLSAVGTDTGLPLDRLSVGTSMIYQDRTLRNETYSSAITALKESVLLQKRNANGGLWYFADPQNLTAYHNLSYLDGMFSYPSFAILAANQSTHTNGDNFGLTAASEQLRILHDICKTSDGLLVHGYDASKAHAWANPKTGASPVVWARSLTWYTLGLLNSLDISRHLSSTAEYAALRQIFVDVSRAQVAAAERSQDLTGRHGVWQVVDRPGASFSGHENYVEASASFMTVYNLLGGVRHGFVGDEDWRRRTISVALGIYHDVSQQYLMHSSNGSLSLNGTSDIASLSGNVDYEYYVTRPIVLNSLIGTSAFILASLELGNLCH